MKINTTGIMVAAVLLSIATEVMAGNINAIVFKNGSGRAWAVNDITWTLDGKTLATKNWSISIPSPGDSEVHTLCANTSCREIHPSTATLDLHFHI